MSSLCSSSLILLHSIPLSLHSGKWFYPLEWLSKVLSWAHWKGQTQKKKIKQKEEEKRFIRAQTPNVLFLMQSSDSPSCFYMRKSGRPEPNRGGWLIWARTFQNVLKGYYYCITGLLWFHFWTMSEEGGALLLLSSRGQMWAHSFLRDNHTWSIKSCLERYILLITAFVLKKSFLVYIFLLGYTSVSLSKGLNVGCRI